MIRKTPPRSPKFTGRSCELAALHRCLRPATTYHSGQLTSCVLNGMAGVGKTELALEYCYLYAAGYKVIFWVTGRTKRDLDRSFTKFGSRINITSNGDENICDNVTSWFEATGGLADDPFCYKHLIQSQISHGSLSSMIYGNIRILQRIYLDKCPLAVLLSLRASEGI